MKKIKVLGTGCPKCKTLASNAEKAVDILGGDYTVEKVEDIGEIVALGVMATPGLALGEKVISAGRVLSPEEIAELVKTNSNDHGGCSSCKGCC